MYSRSDNVLLINTIKTTNIYYVHYYDAERWTVTLIDDDAESEHCRKDWREKKKQQIEWVDPDIEEYPTMTTTTTIVITMNMTNRRTDIV